MFKVVLQNVHTVFKNTRYPLGVRLMRRPRPDQPVLVSFEHFLPLSFIRFVPEKPPAVGGGLFMVFRGFVICYCSPSRAALAALMALESAYCRSNSLAMGRPMGTPSRRKTMGPGSACLADRWKWQMPASL